MVRREDDGWIRSGRERPHFMEDRTLGSFTGVPVTDRHLDLVRSLLEASQFDACLVGIIGRGEGIGNGLPIPADVVSLQEAQRAPARTAATGASLPASMHRLRLQHKDFPRRKPEFHRPPGLRPTLARRSALLPWGAEHVAPGCGGW